MNARTIALTVLISCLIASSGRAQSGFESMKLGQNLGDLLASEEPCGLHYNQAAIQAFITKRVRPDDMDFSGHLALMTAGAGFQLEDMTASAKTAHCAQIGRVAKAYGFIP